jgi:hypothetical protein
MARGGVHMANFLNLVSLITLPKNDRQDLKMGCIDANRRRLQSVLKISFVRPFLDFDCIFVSDLSLKVGPCKIYACVPLASDD